MSERDVGGPFPVHGFVLAGGKSSRMGTDKALLPFHGRPMVEIALETLRGVCEAVSIAGNREDLAGYAQVVPDLRAGEGPAAGIEAALAVTVYDWVLMLPVDVPRMSSELLRRWVSTVCERKNVRASYLECGGEWHPAICLLHRECLAAVRAELDAGDRKLMRIFSRLQHVLAVDAGALMDNAALCFANVNSLEDLAAAERMTY